MNPIAHALNEIRYSIPAQVLQYAFIGNRVRAPRVPISLDAVIRETVIENRVIKDCDIQGGVRTFINLSNLPFTVSEDIYRIYQLDQSMTGGRDVTSAIAVGNGNYISSFTPDEDTSSLVGDVNGILQAAKGTIPLHTSEVRLIGENVIIIEDDVRRYSRDLYLYCVLSNDKEMSNLQVRSQDSFSMAVVLATKSYIYNNTRVRMGSGVLSGGVELGIMREIIDEYADAEELYKEFMRTKWARKSLLNDTTARRKHIRTIVSR